MHSEGIPVNHPTAKAGGLRVCSSKALVDQTEKGANSTNLR